MKIALCLSGQPRGLRAFEYVKRNLLDQYDVDVYCHFWNTGNFEFDISNFKFITRNYQPTAWIVEKEMGPEDAYKYTRIVNSFHPAHFTLSFYRSLYLANSLRIEQEIDTGIKYDWVVRSRFDLALNFVIPFSELDSTKLYVPNDRMNDTHDFCNDQFAYGSPEIMDKYSDTWKHIDEFYAAGVPINGEDLLQANLRKWGLVGDTLVYVDINNPFPPGKYNGNRHSLVRDDIEQWKQKELFFIDNFNNL
jgi:hypothetical protein